MYYKSKIHTGFKDRTKNFINTFLIVCWNDI